ncbi:MAG: hypothetical protein KF865_13600 [Bdellovibrionaceae bacterium]|nr:hypothetical protein [Pseudobdellovibrionaceae bacterium]
MEAVRSLLKRLAPVAGLFLFPALLAACATYQSKVSQARSLLEEGRGKEAIEKLESLARTADGDQLVYLLDYASALQINGQYKESSKAFLQADRLAEAVDYQSVSRVAGSLLLSEEMKQYKGDTFEKIYINAQLALNFLELGQLDDALVEARRMNEKYVKLRGEDKKDFELNPFAKYLSAVVWEADRKYDDALIAYREAYKISPSIQGLPEDLIRASKLAQRPDEYQKWKKTFPHVKENPAWYDKKKGELVVIVQQGWGPRKVFSAGDARWPDLAPVDSRTQSARLEIPGHPEVESKKVYDVQSAAIQTLNDDRASLFARRVGAFAAKEVAADQIRQKNELLGFVAWFAMHASDRADLRQWSTLPQSVQFIRVPLSAGDYKISLQGLGADDRPTADRLESREIKIRPGQKTFVVWRALR